MRRRGSLWRRLLLWLLLWLLLSEAPPLASGADLQLIREVRGDCPGVPLLAQGWEDLCPCPLSQVSRSSGSPRWGQPQGKQVCGYKGPAQTGGTCELGCVCLLWPLEGTHSLLR